MKLRPNKIKYTHEPGGDEHVGIPSGIDYEVTRPLNDPDTFVLFTITDPTPLIVTGLRLREWEKFNAAAEEA